MRLIRATFAHTKQGRIYRGHATHIPKPGTSEPICLNQWRHYRCVVDWAVEEGDRPTCLLCKHVFAKEERNATKRVKLKNLIVKSA